MNKYSILRTNIHMQKKNIIKKIARIPKDAELLSLLATQLEEMKPGERIKPTPLAEKIDLSNGSNPHVDTLQKQLIQLYFGQEVIGIGTRIKLYYDEAKQRITEIEKVDDSNSPERMELKMGKIEGKFSIIIEKIMNRMDSIEKNQDKILKKLDADEKRDAKTT